MPADRTRVIGVDFSGARDAGRKIWIADGTAGGDGLALTDCFRLSDRTEGAVATADAHAALADYLARAAGAVAGLDFPFALPAPLIPDATWTDFVAAFPGRYPTADAFRDACLDATGGRELRRITDVDAKAPFCAYNIRLFRQTHGGIANVLHPLVRHGAGALPARTPTGGAVLLVEACPASFLKREGLYKPPYKGRSPDHGRRRAEILRALVSRRQLRRPKPAIARAVAADAEGDALDAIVAAVCARRAMNDPAASVPASDIERIEARIFY